MTSRRTPALSAVVVAFPLILVALAGCTNTGASSPESSPSPSASSFEDYNLAFAQCMRDKGVDMPDPDGSDSSAPAGNDPAFGAAVEACITELGPAPGGADSPSAVDQHEIDLLLSACLRDNGIDVPDPQPGERISLPMDSARDIVEKCITEAEDGAN